MIFAPTSTTSRAAGRNDANAPFFRGCRSFLPATVWECPLARATGILGFLVLTLWMAPSVRGDAPPPELVTISPENVTVQEGTPLSMVYQFYNPSDSHYPYTYNVTVAPMPAMDFYGPQGAAAGEFTELTAFPGYQAAIGPGQYGQFILPFTTTGSDEGASESWQLSMPPISCTCSWTYLGVNYGEFDPWPFATPTVTLYETPEPSTLALLAVGAIGLIGYGLRRREQKVHRQSIEQRRRSLERRLKPCDASMVDSGP